jgi:DNA-binding response OmpR family regulator
MNEVAGDRILLVDDSEELCFTLEIMLNAAGYSVTVAGSAEAALQTIDEVRPHGVIFDINLPGISGLELCHQLRKRENPPVLIAMSGLKTDAFDRAAGIRIGADDYMVKPIFGDELIARIEAAMRRSVEANRSVHLTKREIQVVEMSSTGASPADIGRSLFISPKTVETHLENIRGKIGARSRGEALEAAEALIP